jgi:hypothetical protein
MHRLGLSNQIPMHTPLLPRHRLRRLVWVTLVAWLFALSAGVLNACVLTPRISDGHGIVAGGDNSVVQHGHNEANAKTSCLKFCADESSALAKTQVFLPDLGVPMLLVLSGWQPVVPVIAIATRRFFDRPMPHGPPLVIRFLRLTL